MTGQRALITGGSRGVGAAVAARLAAAGLTIAVHCRSDIAAAEGVVAGLPGSGHIVVSGDIGDPEQVETFVGEAVSGLGGLDVLVNNAAIHTDQPIASTSYEQWRAGWRRVIDVNVHGTANVTWCFVDHLRTRPEGPDGGRIINVGSRGAYRGEPNAPAYGASKAAVHSMAQSLAVSLAPYGIGVAAVAPGFIRTDMAGPMLAGPAGDGIRAQSPFGRVAEPDDVASAVAWLALPGSLWASGAVIDLNGASYLR
ncbi:SDR family oxidoreductase [Actinoallomurus bryophytorum]|uniref:NAD(P)-dependent dehydrogenase (Short-subunit alcohol dehydrogenase family) n=1 Tax=Actinoallomurus bryophytorum TaxID=1490222 RepID=A0A543CQ68_9ACTN|nr:SDR family oxidoreductase [Actinoallomurus bryophytorum]TQL99235.1 NAD(P)-dependent dehydrogenase (short-subunit alcohol dehydrogenase family) [Actinoallomurus bryophytorum]